MTTASQTSETELANGTWSNFTDGPPVQYKENEKKRAIKEWIQYRGDIEEPVYAANDSIIYSNYRCDIEVRARNRTDLDNMMKDIKDIFKVSDENLTIINLRDLSKKSNYIKIGTVKLIN